MKPTLSLILTDSGLESSVAPQLVDLVAPHVDEIVLITASRQALHENNRTLRHILDGESSRKLQAHVEVSPREHPDLYMIDVEASYGVHASLCGEQFEGPFSGQPIIADWAKVRNLGWRRGSQEWKIFMDSHDELSHPGYLAKIVDLLETNHSNLGYTNYRSGTRCLMTSWIGRNVQRVEWTGGINPTLEGCSKIALFDGGLVKTRHRSVHHLEEDLNTFKVLYAHARQCGWQIPPSNLIRLARLTLQWNRRHMPGFAEAALTTYLDVSLYTEERAWACAVYGELLEARGDNAGASTWYEQAVAEHPGYKAAYRLCRSRFKEEKWQACLEAFQVGLENDSFIHLVDDGNECKETALIWPVTALYALGKTSAAKEYGKILLGLYPHSEAVYRLCESF